MKSDTMKATKDKAKFTLHESVQATMQSMGWEYPYALGYVHGKDDSANGRKREIPLTDTDDFALGYHKGYSI